MRDRQVGDVKRVQAGTIKARSDSEEPLSDLAPVRLQSEHASIKYLEGVETEREYEGLMALSQTTGRRNPPPEVDKETAQELHQKYRQIQSRANAGLHEFLGFIYDCYVYARTSSMPDAYDNLLKQWCPDKMKGVNRHTHPTARLIKAVLGEEWQKKEQRQTVSQWSSCLRYLVESRVPVGTAPEYIASNGGVVKIAKEFSAGRQAERAAKKSGRRPAPASLLKGTWIKNGARKKLEELIKSGITGAIMMRCDVMGDGRIVVSEATHQEEDD